MRLTLSTRGSPLALWQANAATAALEGAWPDLELELLTVSSSGDRDQATALTGFGRMGIFTVEVDRALLDGRAHVGVHSLKDMTTSLEEGIILAAVLARGPVEDVLVGGVLADLPAGAHVGTGAVRRRAMLRSERPDLEPVNIRGNVDRRLAKLDAGEAQALIMARAGLVRLGLEERITEVLDTQRFLPAVGQGIVGLTCRSDDKRTRERLAGICDDATWHAAHAERSLLHALHGGCNAPIGAHATVDGDDLHLRARVLALDGSTQVYGTQTGSKDVAEAIGELLADELRMLGAAELVEAARR